MAGQSLGKKKRIKKSMQSYICLDAVQKLAPKLTMGKLKQNKLYLPDVTEDGGVWKSKGRNRVVK